MGPMASNDDVEAHSRQKVVNARRRNSQNYSRPAEHESRSKAVGRLWLRCMAFRTRQFSARGSSSHEDFTDHGAT